MKRDTGIGPPKKLLDGWANGATRAPVTHADCCGRVR